MKTIQGHFLMKPEELHWRSLQPDAHPEHGLAWAEGHSTTHHFIRWGKAAALALLLSKQQP
jgi:hypothetical protein